MAYSSAALLALIVLLIINHDVLLRRPGSEKAPALRSYRAFLVSVAIYFLTDILWGYLYDRRLITAVFFDTSVYFAAMATSILYWTRYVVDYLHERRFFGRALQGLGFLFFGLQLLAVFINYFYPILFTFDAAGEYHAESARYATLLVQIAMFVMTAVYAFVVAGRSRGVMKFRYRTVALSSVVMAGFALAQVYHPLLPLYAVGCLLSCCVLHSFVLENEKDEYLVELEERLEDNVSKGNYYDLLTELPGMTYFFELAQEQQAQLVAAGQTPSFLFLDLSGMKIYNQKYGFTRGDQLLKDLARLLIAEFGDESCSRFGQDHFAVLTSEEGLADRLSHLFDIWSADGDLERPAIRVGVFCDPTGQTDVSVACDRAKVARDTIRSTYVSDVRYFDMSMLKNTEIQRYVVSHLDKALSEGWVQVYYQPIVRAVSGRVCDEEALARWIDPNHGFLSPGDFIPALERANLIYKLDLYVLEQVLEKIRVQKDVGLYVVPHSINLSRSDFDACDMVEEIRARVDAAGVGRDKITVEITESVIGRDFEFMSRQIERFQALGIAVWMDDFGSGYSSLDALQSMQFDLIKFDMSFMRRLDEGDRGKNVLTGLMRMATSLGSDTVCEGVETEEQIKFLQEIGCSKLQGFYYVQPIPFERVLERYETGTQIGFENPDETAYYESIGRASLYDLSTIANEDASALRNYFDTVPMGILECKDETVRIVRSNSSYRDFVWRMFGVDLTDETMSLDNAPQRPGFSFMALLRQCCQSDDSTFFDDPLPNGSTAHAFMHRISVNPVTGAVAVAVAVWSITDASEGVSYAEIARALVADYYNLYYVDLLTNQFIEYSSPVGGEELALARHGVDFFAASRRDIKRFVYADDQEALLASFTKENVIKELDERGVFVAKYRLVGEGALLNVRMKVMRMRSDGNHIIAGISIVDS